MKHRAKCLKTKKPHQMGLSKRNCYSCNAIKASRWIKTEKGKVFAKKRAEKQRDTTAKQAYRLVSNGIRYNGWPKPSEFPCSDCDRTASIYDHRDYLKPWEIDPVCRKCNFKRGPGKNNFKNPLRMK